MYRLSLHIAIVFHVYLNILVLNARATRLNNVNFEYRRLRKVTRYKPSKRRLLGIDYNVKFLYNVKLKKIFFFFEHRYKYKKREIHISIFYDRHLIIDKKSVDVDKDGGG